MVSSYYAHVITSPCGHTGTAVGMVIYTGNETRSVMNTSSPKSKVNTAINCFLFCT